MTKQSYWDDHDPSLVVLGIMAVIVVSLVVIGIGVTVYNLQPAWHDIGTVQSIGHMSTWDNSISSFQTTWNLTFTTQNHGTITVVQQHTCGFYCGSIIWTLLRVNETIGIIRANGGQYTIQELN